MRRIVERYKRELFTVRTSPLSLKQELTKVK